MAYPSEKSIIEIPLKIALSPEGVNLFLQSNRPLQKIQFADLRDTFGLTVARISTDTIKQLLNKNYITGIEASDSDILSKRDDILTLNTLLFRTALQERFNAELKSRFLKSRLIYQWNRANPQKAITENLTISEASIKKIFNAQGEELKKIQDYILAPVYYNIEKEVGAQTEEGEALKELANAFFKNQGPFNWYILAFIKDKEDRSFYTEISSLINKYIKRSKIGDFLGTTLIELIMNAENSNIYSFAIKKNIPGVKIDQIFQDQLLRNKILTSMSKAEQKLYVLWSFKEIESRQGTATRFQITVYNREYKAQIVEDSIKEQSKLSEKSMEQYLASAGSSLGSVDMTGFYLQSVKQECESLSIFFDSTVTQLARNDIAAITLTLQF